MQSSQGSFRYSGQYPYLKTRRDLFDDVQKYAVQGYAEGDMSKWRKHFCVAYLGADSWLRSLTSSGCAYPLSITAKVRFACEREYIEGMGACASTVNKRGGPAVQRDCIYGKPIMLQIFDKSALSLSPSSGLLSSQNLSHASAMDILARQQ